MNKLLIIHHKQLWQINERIAYCGADELNILLADEVKKHKLVSNENIDLNNFTQNFQARIQDTLNDKRIEKLWIDERIATSEGIYVLKKMAIEYLSSERGRILSMSREEAVRALIKMNKIESRIEQIKKVTDNNILSLK